MTIPIPTIDDFDTSTVMTTIREVVDYLIGMVPQINNGDITDLQTSYTNNVLTITLVKGDGTTISKNVTIQASGGESPYPTDVALSLSGTVLNCDIMLSDNTHVTGSQDLATFATYTEVQGIQSDLQEQITNIKPTVSVNESVTPPTISVSVNGTTSTANLPVSGEGGFIVPTVRSIEYNTFENMYNKLSEIPLGASVTLVAYINADVRYKVIITGTITSAGITVDITGFGMQAMRTQQAYTDTYPVYSTSISSGSILFDNVGSPPFTSISASTIKGINAYVITTT